MATTKRRNAGWEHDPKTRVNRKRLQARIDHLGTSANRLANSNALRKTPGANQRTLSSFLTGRTNTLRRSVVEKLAEEVAVDVRWLTGETDLPNRSWTINEAGEHVPLGDPDAPPKTQLEQGALLLACREALNRQIQEGRFGADLMDQYYNILPAVQRLTQPSTWEAKLLVHDVQDTDYPVTAQDDWDEAGTALARAFRVILGPWLRGQASINHQALLGVFDDVLNPKPRPNTTVDCSPEVDYSKPKKGEGQPPAP